MGSILHAIEVPPLAGIRFLCLWHVFENMSDPVKSFLRA